MSRKGYLLPMSSGTGRRREYCVASGGLRIQITSKGNYTLFLYIESKIRHSVVMARSMAALYLS